MNELITLMLSNAALIVTCMVLLWLLSIPLKDVSFIDSFWPIGFLVVALGTYFFSGTDTPRSLVIVAITAVWSLRLGIFLFTRWRREGMDGRYAALLKKAPGNVHLFTLRKVFLLQGGMLFVVSLPIQFGQLDQDTPLGPLAYFGILLGIIGILFESIGDQQMTVFKRDTNNKGKVMNQGLWRFTRHPNYFGDCCVFWGLFFIAAETAMGLFSLPGVLLITWTLCVWSGAPLLERRMQRSKPEYADYIKTTSGFIPWFPKTNKTASVIDSET